MTNFIWMNQIFISIIRSSSLEWKLNEGIYKDHKMEIEGPKALNRKIG